MPMSHLSQPAKKPKKSSIVASYLLSIALLSMVAMDFMGYTIPLKPLIVQAATYISPLNNGASTYSYSGSGLWCPHGSPKFYYTEWGASQNAYWYACRN